MMKRGSLKAQGNRLAACVRALCLLLCCALALQPSLLASGRAASRARSAVRPQSSFADFTAHSLLTVAASIAAALPAPAGARENASRIPPAHLNTYDPEPAAAAVAVFISAPISLTIFSASDSQIVLSWPAVSGAVSYKVERSPDLQSQYILVGEPASSSFQNTGLTRGTAYLYRVRAVDGTGMVSAPSPVVMATAITFTDPELVAANDSLGRQATLVKAVHLNELRLAVDGVRHAAGKPAAAWQEVVNPGVPVRADHVRELRSKLNEALAALGLPTPAYTDPTLYTGQSGSTPTPIRKVHFEELRERATHGSGVTGSGGAAFDFASARLDPSNRTGAGGVDLLSRNFNWSLSLVSLPGRAGLNLGLTLSYNSLVWTRSGNSILFDGDGGWPAPGFRLGFPVVQFKFYDAQAQQYAYMLLTPSGARVSLRQAATPGTYEAGDSSYLQLIEETDGTLTLRTTDGTRMSYQPQGGVYKCAQIKDKNGNFITAAYNDGGNLQTVTDTLGRVVNFGYDPYGYLDEITQTWHRAVEGGAPVTETHRWAKFYYGDKVVRTNFAGLTSFGPANGQSIHALIKVKLADDSSFTFNYTTWGQVNQVAGYAADGRLLNYVSLDVPADETAAQSDCPRPTQRRDWAAYWNGDENGTGAASEEAITFYGPYNFAGGVAKATAPDGTIHQETYETSGWKKGLVTRADEFGADDLQHPKKWTTLTWTQDDEVLTYQQNPRVRESNIYDSNPDGSVRDRRRTEVVYTSFGLPQDVKEYDSNATTVLRRTHMEYVSESVNTGGAYTLRRIIGLPQKQEVYGSEGGQEKLFSKITFEYDLPNAGSTLYLSDGGAVAQHDNAYGAGFGLRGNVCRTRRWDVTDALNQSKSVASEAGYDTLGSKLFTSDPSGHKMTFSYADSDGGVRLAYPTKVTDPDSFYSTLEYNYDTGAVTRAVDPKGAATKTFYDSAGRVLKTKSEVNGAYTGFEYGASGLYAKLLTKVDADKPETFVVSVADGAGRLRATLRELPGSVGGYAGRRFTYDLMGRQAGQSNPVEVSADVNNLSNVGGWQPAGDDATSNGGTGWVYATQTYDWKGRPRFTTNTDGTTRQASYDGCGCAGGEVVTLTDEVGRRQRIYSDALGRGWKTEVLNWDGSVYSTTESTFNALDQAISLRRFQGTDQSGELQETTFGYDGHGRLRSRHTPEQEAGKSTVYAYNADDTAASITDARGAVTAYGYNNGRHLVTGVSYSVPAGVAVPPSVTFGYDAAGNRTSMTTANNEGGSAAYHYDTLSRLTSEDRQFPGLSGTYVLSYRYTLAGSLKSVTDESNPAAPVSFSYDFDSAGQVTAVNSAGMGATAALASNVKYRAWGALKSEDYGNGTGAALAYDARGLLTSYALTGAKDNATGQVRPEGGGFQYYPDGLLKFASDYRSDAQTSGIQDRAYSYDHGGRMLGALTGTDARNFINGVNSNVADGPYRMAYAYDPWGNQLSRTGRYWSQYDEDIAAYSPQTNRNPQWSYDADGRLLSRNEPSPNGLTYAPTSYTYDAAGRLAQTAQTTSRPHSLQPGVTLTTSVTQTDTYDGGGLGLRHVMTKQVNSGTPSITVTYYLRSAVLGGRAVSEYGPSGARQTSYAWSGRDVLAQQTLAGTPTPVLRWEHLNPVTGDGVETDASGKVKVATHLDPDGVNAGESDPFGGAAGDPSADGGGAAVEGQVLSLIAGYLNMRCTVDGVLSGCGPANKVLEMGAASECPYADCGPRSVVYRGRRTWAFFRAYADGYQGFVPASASYVGDGRLSPASNGRPSLGQRGRGAVRDTDLTALNGGNYKEEQELGHSLDVMFSNAAFILQRTTQRVTRTRAKFNYERLRTCLSEKFNVVVSDFDIGFEDNVGKFKGSFGPGKTEFEIKVDLSSRSMSDISRITGKKDAMAMADPNDRWLVYVGNDSFQKTYYTYLVAAELHEIGNKIYQEFSPFNLKKPEVQSDYLRAIDGDAGQALEECVFGGQVFRDGRVIH
jgi:YD repeat-containing protein